MIELLSCNEVSFLFFLFYFVFDFNLGGFVGIWYFSVFFFVCFFWEKLESFFIVI